MEDVANCIKELEAREGFQRGEAASENALGELERALGHHLPDCYRMLLSQVGYVSVDGFPVYGISGDSFYCVLSREKRLRETEVLYDADLGMAPLPMDAFLIADDGAGRLWMLFNGGSERRGQVAEFVDEELNAEVRFWPNLGDFLKDYYKC